MNTAETLSPTVEQKSRWEDILDVFFSPADLFRRRGNDRLGPPLITLLVLALAFYYLLLPAQKIMMRAGIAAQQARMPEGATMPAGSEGMMNIMTYAGGIMQPIIYLVMVALMALILFVLCRIVGARPTFRQMMIVTTYAGFIGLLGQVVMMVAVMLHGEAGLDLARHMSVGPNRFMPEGTSKTLRAVLGLFEVFTVWQAIVWGIGVYVITGVSKGKAAVVAGIAWLVMIIPALIGSMFTPPAAGGSGAEIQVVE